MPTIWNKRDPAVPKDAVYVGRPTQWGNPYIIGPDGTRQEVVMKYRTLLRMRPELAEPLRGRDLVCFCVPFGGVEWTPEMAGNNTCHCFPLMELANRGID